MENSRSVQHDERSCAEDSRLSRRGFVRWAAGGMLVGTAALFEACAPSPAPGPQPTSGATTSAPTSVTGLAPTAPVVQQPKPAAAKAVAVKLPMRIPVQGVKADLAPSDDGLIDAGFYAYPANPFTSVQNTPGRGGEVTAVTWITSAIPPPMEQNALWQAVNKEVGVTLKINIVSYADYQTKLATVLAGSDLPDIIFGSTTLVGDFPSFMKARCADLTPYLGGDAIKEYPNLANYPTLAWSRTVFNNALYGVPVVFPVYQWVHWVHQELLDAEAIARPTTAAEYKQALVHFTRPAENLWGLGTENNNGYGTTTTGLFSAMFGAPNTWALDEKTGKLTHFSETEQLRAAVSYARDLWAGGVYHPKSSEYNLVSARADFTARRFVFRMDGFAGAPMTFWDNAASLDPPGKFRILPAFAHDGGTPIYWGSTGIQGFSVLKKAPEARIKELLRVLDYLAAPFGSQEYLLLRYGVRDVHHTLDQQGNPILTPQGRAETTVPFMYLTQPQAALYKPNAPDYADVLYQGEQALYPHLQLNPTDAYYSPTYANRSIALTQTLTDGIGEIVRGRQPLGYLDEVIRAWRAGGGDQSRAEYEAAIAAAA